MGRKGQAKKIAKQILGKGLQAAKKLANDPKVKQVIRKEVKMAKRRAMLELNAATGGVSGKILGMGDYHFSSNFKGAASGPKRALSVANSIIIEREEFIIPVVTDSTVGGKKTKIQKFRVNPGNYITFPWGSQVALGYESYEPLGIQFIFDSTSGELVSGTDTSLGKVCMAAQYNSYARDWDTFIELENANDSVCCATSESAILGIENKPSLRGAKTLYVSQSDPVSAGKGFYDICDVYVATTGLQGVSVRVGDLKIRYRIKLFNPIVRDSEVPSMNIQASFANASANDTLATTTATLQENLTARHAGATLTWTANTLAVANLRPTVGRMLLTVQLQKFGTVGTRVGGSCAYTCSYLGASLTPVASFVNLDQGYPTSVSSAQSAYSGAQILPAEIDSFTLTFSGFTGVSSDNSRLIITMSPYDTSDF
jgi:hypothetical protein